MCLIKNELLMVEYKERIADRILSEKLEGMGAVLIEGAKWCGKTTTAEHQAGSILYMNDPKRRHMNIQLASMNPEILLKGETPRLIDEWQIAPSLWDSVRFECDHRKEDGQFILTGSSVPVNNDEDEEAFSHSGTGRISRLKMRPMSLWESGDSEGNVSLRDLFNGGVSPVEAGGMNLEQLAYLVCRGGWPKATLQRPNVSLGRAFDYYQSVTEVDINRVDKVKRDSEKAKRLLRSYSRHQGTQVSLSKIRSDMQSNETDSMSEKTIDDYLDVFRKIFVIEDMHTWNPNLRSKTAIRTTDTRYFVDPSIAVAALGVGPNDLINDLETFGLLFETMAVRDLRVYADALNGNVYHYRDKDGLECDSVVHLRSGKYGLVEIKIGGNENIEAGARSLLALSNKIDTTKMPEPSFMMVLTGLSPYAFQRPDGVWVVPIGCLKD